MTRTHLLVTALLAALLSSGAVAANAGPLPIPDVPTQGYIPQLPPLPQPDPKWPLLPRFDPKFPSVPWLPTLPSNRKDHPLPIPLPPEFYYPADPAPAPLVLPTCTELLPEGSAVLLDAEHLDVPPTTIDGRYGIEDPELVTLLTAREQISCTWQSSTTKGSMTISIVLLDEPADSTAILDRFIELGYTGGPGTGYGTWDGHFQQYNVIPAPTGPALAQLPYWIAVQDNVDGGGTAQPYMTDAMNQFLTSNHIAH